MPTIFLWINLENTVEIELFVNSDELRNNNELNNMTVSQNFNNKPTQAVILAGGRGQRLLPITEKIPKPMVSFHGKPFLEYIIEYLKKEGFKDVVLLLGYLHEQVTSYFGDGSKLGINIKYSITDIEHETGLRLLAARDMLEPTFFLMYCDNYCPVDTLKAWDHFCSKKDILAQVTAYSNLDNFSRNNLRIEDGFVVSYDKSRSQTNLNGVEIGFAFMRSKVLDLMPNENLNFEKLFILCWCKIKNWPDIWSIIGTIVWVILIGSP